MPKYNVFGSTIQEYVLEIEAEDLQSAYAIASSIDVSDERWQEASFEFQLGFAEEAE